MRWKSDHFGSLYRTCWLFLTLAACLTLLSVEGLMGARPLGSRSGLYLIAVGLVLYYHMHALVARFKGYAFNVAACWLAAFVLIDVWLTGGIFGIRDLVLLCSATLLLVPSIWMQVKVLGSSLFTRQGAFLLLWSAAVILLALLGAWLSSSFFN